MSKRLLTIVLILLAVAAICAGTFNTSVSSSLAELQHSADQRLELYATSLDSEIERFSRLPAVLDLMPPIGALLHQSADHALQTRANQDLEKLSARTGALAIYILDLRGQVVATSNWRRPDSYLGENDAFRPYFQQALHDRPSHFFGIGTSRSEPGYYLSQALYDGSSRLGVAVVKISLEQLERSWAASRAMVWVTDSNRVVIIASRAQWKFATLGALSPAEILRFEQNRQYNRLKLQPLQLETLRHLSPVSSIVRERSADGRRTPGYRYLTQTRPLTDSNWKLTMLSSLGPIYNLALMRAALAGGVTILVLTGLFWLKERRRRLRDRLAAREALQAAYQQLERKVEERTADLSASNQQLQAQISERVRAEQHLRQTQDELLQAGKLAVIGQLSTEVAHELNQPLAALRTISGNTVKYLARGDLGTASTNLETIGQLVERMGRITGALRSFAHKPRENMLSADLGQALDQALLLLEQRIHQQQVLITRDRQQEQVLAQCHPNRLEQLLINLLANALDAMAGQAHPRIDITCRESSEQVSLCIRDNGPGLSPSAQEHLFEPFFTTKPADAGLGLGLALSASIATEAGGSLSAENPPQGGAAFTLTLPLAIKEQDRV